MGTEEQSHSPALRPPEEVLSEREALARAALAARAIEVVASKDGKEFESPHRPYIVLSVPRSWPSVIRLGSPAAVEPVLERHGFHVAYYRYYEDEDGEAIRVQFTVHGELDWSRRMPPLAKLIEERLPIAVAEVVANGAEVIEVKVLRRPDDTSAVLLVRPLTTGPRLLRNRWRRGRPITDSLTPRLARHGLRVDRCEAAGGEGDAGLLRIWLKLSDKLDWTREHPLPRTLVQQRLPLVVSELSSLGAEIIEARPALVPSDGILELHRSTFSKLGLTGPTDLESEFDRHGLRLTKVRHSSSGDQRLLELQLELHAELDWTRSVPFTTEVVAARLAEVAAEFVASGAEVVSSQVEQGGEELTGRLLLRGSPPPASAQPADLVVSDFVVSFDRRGWALEQRGRYHRLEGGIGSSARRIKTEAWGVLREEARREKARRDEPTIRNPDPASQMLAAPDWAPIAATIIIVPFVQALAGKFADDVYAKLRTFFHRRSVQDVAVLRALFDGEPAVERGAVTIRDPDAGTELVVPGPLPDKAIKQLVTLGPERIRGQVLIWNETAQTWRLAGD